MEVGCDTGVHQRKLEKKIGQHFNSVLDAIVMIFVLFASLLYMTELFSQHDDQNNPTVCFNVHVAFFQNITLL